jgi:periplasmic copper chaperone A
MRAPIAAAALLLLSACHKAANAPDTRGSISAAAIPVASGTAVGKPALQVVDGELILPAVAGNPGAAYFTVVNDGRTTTTISAIAIAGTTSTEIHQTQGGSMGKVDRIETDPGTRIAFAPGGLHVMVFGVPSSLKPAQTIGMTISFADGAKLTVPLTAKAPGDVN